MKVLRSADVYSHCSYVTYANQIKRASLIHNGYVNCAVSGPTRWNRPVDALQARSQQGLTHVTADSGNASWPILQ